MTDREKQHNYFSIETLCQGVYAVFGDVNAGIVDFGETFGS